MYLDRCVVCCESDLDDYFELHEITSKDTYILKVSFFYGNPTYMNAMHVNYLFLYTLTSPRYNILLFGMFPGGVVLLCGVRRRSGGGGHEKKNNKNNNSHCVRPCIGKKINTRIGANLRRGEAEGLSRGGTTTTKKKKNVLL